MTLDHVQTFVGGMGMRPRPTTRRTELLEEAKVAAGQKAAS